MPDRTGHREAGFFDAGLDASQPDQISQDEENRLLSWYTEIHGEGDLALTPLAKFMITERPADFKAYRAHVSEIALNTAPDLAAALVTVLFLYYYTTIRDERGIHAQVIAARAAGVSRSELLDIAGIAFISAGPLSMNAFAAAVGDYFENWAVSDTGTKTGIQPRSPWPSSWWEVQVDASELPYISEWFGPGGKGDSAGRDFISRYHPNLTVTYRSRWSKLLTQLSLPIPVIPLLRLHRSTITQDWEGARRACELAAMLRVDRSVFIQALMWAFLYCDESAIDTACEQLGSLIEMLPGGGTPP